MNAEPETASDWKQDLLKRCSEAIEGLPQAPETAVAEPPSLYQFYERLLAFQNEVRQGNRKTAQTFASFGDVLEAVREDSVKLRNQFARDQKRQEQLNSISRNLALAMIDFSDRLQRLKKAAWQQAENSLLSFVRGESRWRQQAEAIEILSEHLDKLLAKTGLERIDTEGQGFDPLWMKAVESVSNGDGKRLVVCEEILPGYRLGEHCLRPAEVRLEARPALPPSRGGNGDSPGDEDRLTDSNTTVEPELIQS